MSVKNRWKQNWVQPKIKKSYFQIITEKQKQKKISYHKTNAKKKNGVTGGKEMRLKRIKKKKGENEWIIAKLG